jgi:hypothetical protein
VALCERTFSYQGSMRALAEAHAEDGDGLEPPEEEGLEDEEDPQDLDDLNLTMEVRDAGGDGAGLAGEGPRPDAPAAA